MANKSRNIYLTLDGKDLWAEYQKGGYSIEFPKVQLGSGMTYKEYTPEQIEKVKAVETVEVELTEITVVKEGQEPGVVLVKASLNTSAVIQKSFRNSEIGLISRLKKEDGTYYPSEEGILYTYRNIGDEGDYIPKKEEGEAWSITYNLATLVSNCTNVTPTIKIGGEGEVTRKEFEDHINNVKPHPNFLNTGKQVHEDEEVQFINVNYDGSGKNLDWISKEEFKEKVIGKIGDIKEHIESTDPHPNFIRTGEELKDSDQIRHINVNYSGSGGSVSWVSPEKFKEDLNLVSIDNKTVFTSYIEKDKTKKITDILENLDWIKSKKKQRRKQNIYKQGLFDFKDLSREKVCSDASIPLSVYDGTYMTGINQHIPREIISNSTDKDRENYYTFAPIWGKDFKKIEVERTDNQVMLVCEVEDFTTIQQYILDNVVTVGTEFLMKLMNIFGQTGYNVKFLGTVWEGNTKAVIFSSDEIEEGIQLLEEKYDNKIEKCKNDTEVVMLKREKEGAVKARLRSLKNDFNDLKDYLIFDLTTSILVDGMVYPKGLFDNDAMDISSQGLDWTNLKPIIDKKEETVSTTLGNNKPLNICGEIIQDKSLFKTGGALKNDYFNGFRFNNDANNLIGDSLVLSAQGAQVYDAGLFGNKAYKPAGNTFLYSQLIDKPDKEFKGMYSKLLDKKSTLFESWVKPNKLGNKQVIYNEYQTVVKTYKQKLKDENTIFFVNFNGKTDEERKKDKVSGNAPYQWTNTPLGKGGAVAKGKEDECYYIPYGKTKKVIYKLPDSIGEGGDFTCEFLCWGDKYDDDGLQIGLGYILEDPKTKQAAWTEAILWKITGGYRDEEYGTNTSDNFICATPQTLKVDKDNIITETWTSGSNYDISRVYTIWGGPPHEFYEHHKFFHFNYNKEKGFSIISPMYERGDGGKLGTRTWQKGPRKRFEYFRPSLPKGYKFVGYGIRILDYDHDHNWGSSVDEMKITKGKIDPADETRILNALKPYDYLGREEHTETYEAPMYKIWIENNKAGAELCLERIINYQGEADNKIANTKIYKALVKDKLKASIWSHITITDINGEPVLYIGDKPVSWASSEDEKYRLPETCEQTQAIKNFKNVIIGGGNLMDVSTPAGIKEDVFDGLIQDLGMRTVGESNKILRIFKNAITNITIPIAPLLDNTIRGVAYATEQNQAIPFVKIKTEGIEQHIKLASASSSGYVKMLFAKETSGASVFNLCKLELKNDVIELTKVGEFDSNSGQLYEMSKLIETEGNTFETIQGMFGKKFNDELITENGYLYPFIFLSNSRVAVDTTMVQDLKFDETRTIGKEILEYNDTKELDLGELTQIVFLRDAVDLENSHYNFFNISFEGMKSSEEWEEIEPGTNLINCNYKKLRANLYVNFGEEHKQDGVLKVQSVEYFYRTGEEITVGENSRIITKPIIWDAQLKMKSGTSVYENTLPKEIHGFVKYVRDDMFESDIHKYYVKLANLKHVIQTFTYKKSEPGIVLGNVLVNTEPGYYRKADCNPTEDIIVFNGIRVVVERGSGIEELSRDMYNFSTGYEEGQMVSRIAILDEAEVQEGETVSVMYHETDLGDEETSKYLNQWIEMDKVGDSTYLNDIVVSQFKYKLPKEILKNNLIDNLYITTKLETITNRYIDYTKTFHNKSQEKVQKIFLGYKRKIDKSSVQVFVGGQEIPKEDFSIIGGDGVNPCILTVNLTEYVVGEFITLKYKYLDTQAINGFSDMGVLLV